MALFNRDYDRDFGDRDRGGGAYRGYDRDLGDRVSGGLRRGWERMTGGARNAFGRDRYDRDYGYRGGESRGTVGFSLNSGYDRDLGGRSWWVDEAWTQDRDLLQHRGAYDHDFTYRGTPGSNVDGGLTGRMEHGSRYGADYPTGYGAGMHRGYDRDLGGRDRWETDNGDPFGDRQSGTPIRVIRGGFRRGQGHGNPAYDRDPRWNRGNMGYDRGFHSSGRGYDRGWF
ncbi:MAG TPA: hypothetical protein VHG28_18525 [Longimicrobiaceae bacterium]|nr:hypothetical protein [Longimicrobiaceae bacterium]